MKHFTSITAKGNFHLLSEMIPQEHEIIELDWDQLEDVHAGILPLAVVAMAAAAPEATACVVATGGYLIYKGIQWLGS
jgi:hypothetical protein